MAEWPTKTIPEMTPEQVDRFWSRFAVTESGCWEWQGRG